MTALTCTHDGVTVILKGEGNGIDSRIVARHAFASATRTSAYNAKSASMNLNSRCYSGLSALLAKPDQEADTKRASMVNAEFGRQLPDTLQRPEFKPYAQIHGMGRGHKNSPRPREILTWKESYSCQKYGLCESITANATRQYHQYAPALDFKRMLAMLDTIQAESASMNLNSRCYSGLSSLLAKPDQEADTKRASMVSAAFGRRLPDVLQRPEFKPYAHIHGMGRGHKNSPRPRGILTWKESYSCQKYGLCESITANATRQYHQYAPALDFKRMVFEQAVDVVINEKDRQFLTTHPLQLHWGLTSGAGLSTCNSKTNKSLTQTVDPQQTFAATNGEHRGKADLLHKQQYETPCYCQKDARITGKSQRFSTRKARVIEGLRGMSGIKSTSELNGGRS